MSTYEIILLICTFARNNSSKKRKNSRIIP